MLVTLDLAGPVNRVTVPPSGVVARVAERMESLGEVMVDGVPLPVVKRSFGELEGLPEPEAGVLVRRLGARC
jgi:hypothetical protein